jgi:hypothetical protein
MTQPTEEEILKTWDTEAGSINLSGTFFCDSTTAQSFPRTPTEVMFAAVMALNAYSVHSVSSRSAKVIHPLLPEKADPHVLDMHHNHAKREEKSEGDIPT